MADSADHNDQEEPIYECTEPWWLCAVSEANPQKKRKVQEETEETASDDVSPCKGQGQGQGQKAKVRRVLATIAVSKDTLHESAQLLKGKGKNWLPPQQGTQYNPGFIPKQWNHWR